MNHLGEATAMSVLFLSLASVFVLPGPLGKALAEWIRGWSKHDEQWLAIRAAKQGVVVGGEAELLLPELEELKRRLAEIEERLDFTERLLAQERSGDRLAPPR